MKKARRGNVITSAAVERDHPDGGTFGILTMDTAAAEHYAKVVTKEEPMRDNGHVLFTPGRRKQVVTRSVLAISDLVGYAIGRLDYVRWFVIEGVFVDLQRMPDGRFAFVSGRARKVAEDEWTFDEHAPATAMLDGKGNPAAQQFGPKAFSPDEMLDYILKMPAESEIPFFVWYDKDGKVVTEDDADFETRKARKERHTRIDTEGYHSWVVRAAAELAEETLRVVRGNSSTAPSTSLDLSSAVTTTTATE
ncbi:MAG: hypothetical protein ACXW5J_26675 [Thermoanaerobaculia bacterium]